MKSRARKLLCGLLWTGSFVLGATAWAGTKKGNEMGNGTDNAAAEDGAAWFLGSTRTIRYCLVSSPDFGVAPETLNHEIKAAFQTWADYVVAKKVDSRLTDSTWLFATNVEAMLSCDGQEDLKFYFGVEDERVRAEKARYDKPTAFAHRMSFDKTTSWSQGFVWLTSPGTIDPVSQFPRWSKEKTLAAILLHEVGHIFGVGHVSYTIMDASLSDQLQLGLPAKLQTSVDGKRELIFCWSCTIKSPGVLGTGTGVDEDVKVFKELLGREAKGDIHASLEASSIWSGLIITLSDELGTTGFKIRMPPQEQGPSIELSDRLFWRYKAGNGIGAIADGHILFGSLVLTDSRELSIVLEVNMTNFQSIGPITLKTIKNGLPHTLFRSLPKSIGEGT